jgi:hypothetical protein
MELVYRKEGERRGFIMERVGEDDDDMDENCG